MSDEEQDGSGRPFSWNRRRVLTATTLGITGLAGCGGSGDSGDDEEDDDEADETTELNGSSPSDDSNDVGSSSDDDGNGSNSESIPVNECPMIPGSYTTFDPGTGPIPYSFEYPEAVAPVEYGERKGNIVSGRFQRTEDLAMEGDITMTAAVNPNLRREGARDSWYEERSDWETFLTTTINGSEVTFVAQVERGISSEDRTAHSVAGLAPYNWDDSEDSVLGGITYHEVSMGIRLSLRDDETIADSCVENLLATLEQSVESIEMQSAVTLFEEEVV